jgi:hypothetical protein
MDFIMRAWRNTNPLLFWLLLLSVWLTNPVQAGEFSAQIKEASLEPFANWYVLNADVEYVLSPKAKEAIQNSIPLFWQLKVHLKQQRYFKDKTVMRVNYRYRIRYHALLNSYSVKNETTHTLKKFASLAEALDSLSRIRELKIIAVSALKADKNYTVAMRIEFNKEDLPPPLRPVAYISPQWDLSSDWYLWPLKK